MMVLTLWNLLIEKVSRNWCVKLKRKQNFQPSTRWIKGRKIPFSWQIKKSAKKETGKMGRRYGFFRCSDCGAKWESSHVYSKGSEKNNVSEKWISGTIDRPAFSQTFSDKFIRVFFFFGNNFNLDIALVIIKIVIVLFSYFFSLQWYTQECKKCGTAHQPYRTEPIKCRHCEQHDCICTQVRNFTLFWL